jgi:hypothetical protein
MKLHLNRKSYLQTEENKRKVNNMKRSDFQLIGYVGTVLGALFLVSGIFASVYFVVHRSLIIDYYWVEYPYQKYAGSLLVAGIVLLVVGLGFLWRAKQEKEAQKVAPQVPTPPETT